MGNLKFVSGNMSKSIYTDLYKDTTAAIAAAEIQGPIPECSWAPPALGRVEGVHSAPFRIKPQIGTDVLNRD